MDFRFSVLIPVYYKEKPEYFSEALASVINQTLKPNEIVVVKDGPLTDGLEEVLAKYDATNPGLFKIVSLETNQGLGVALAKGVEECSYELIARMDSDDISRSDRFEKQIAEFEKDPDLDICGSQIAEFVNNRNNIVSIRRVPIIDIDIKKFQKFRTSFNHPSVIFRKSTVLSAGNYQSYVRLQDSLLWVRMFIIGSKCKNINEWLLYFRISEDFYKRRGGLNYFKRINEVRREMVRLNFISECEYLILLPANFLLAIVPNWLRAFIYKRFLHHQ